MGVNGKKNLNKDKLIFVGTKAPLGIAWPSTSWSAAENNPNLKQDVIDRRMLNSQAQESATRQQWHPMRGW